MVSSRVNLKARLEESTDPNVDPNVDQLFLIGFRLITY